jgi:hypothetical protein
MYNAMNTSKRPSTRFVRVLFAAMNDMQKLGDAQWSRPLRELRKLSDEQLVDLHDSLAQDRSIVDIGYYLDELARRDARRQTQAMLRMTAAILVLTLINAALVVITIAND